MMKWLLPAALLALSGCGKTGNLDGFKDLKFGLSKDAVEQLGFACPSDGACSASTMASASGAQGGPADWASANPVRGQQAFGKCAACHTIIEGGANGIGPNLYAVAGTPIGTGRGGYNFSDALKAKGGNWTFEALDVWLQNPAAFAPGTKMTFAGISDPQQRADVIAYLNAQGSNLPLPAPGSRRSQPTPPVHQAPAFTLFGKTARVTPTLKGGKIDAVEVVIDLNRDEVINLFKKEYGDHKEYEFVNAIMARIHVTYWKFDNSTSISIRSTVSEGPLGPKAMLRREGLGVIADMPEPTSIYYLGDSGTAKLMQEAKGNSVDPNDT